MKEITSSLAYSDADFISIIFVLCLKQKGTRQNVVLLYNDGIYARSSLESSALKRRVIK